MSKRKVEVTIDSNEAAQNPEMTEIFVLHEDVEDYRIEPLDDGDIVIGDCIFERKTPGDFASSMEDGHLRDQVERMGGRGMKSFILIEGDMGDYGGLDFGPPAKSCRGMDASIEVRNNIPVKYCSNAKNLADMAVRLARKTEEEPISVQAVRTGSTKELSFMENFFYGIEGIGVEMAERLAGVFDSVEKAYNADLEEFKKIEGIGSSRAKDIYSSVHGPGNSTQNEEEPSTDDVTVVSI